MCDQQQQRGVENFARPRYPSELISAQIITDSPMIVLALDKPD